MTSIERHKHPRIFHLPFSPGVQSDDKVLHDYSLFANRMVVASLKMDGENTSLYSDGYMHARSIDGASNWTRDVAKSIQSVIQYDIPEGWRICCENVYAKHSIYYPDGYLEGYLYVHSVWNEKNECLSYKDTLEYAQLLDLPVPKLLYNGIFDLKALEKVAQSLDTSIEEGFVVRLVDTIPFEQFSQSVVKYVRDKHVQTDEHWLNNATPNGRPKSPVKPYFMQK